MELGGLGRRPLLPSYKDINTWESFLSRGVIRKASARLPSFFVRMEEKTFEHQRVAALERF